MTALWELSWRLWPCLTAMELGALVAARGFVLAWRGARTPLHVPGKNWTWMRGFRLAILGLSVLGIGAAWLWQLPWLLALSLVVGFEETLETSIAAWALKQEFEADTAARRTK